MVTLPSDYTIVGTVLAIAIAILLLSGLALYVSFRVRETLHEEKGRGARAAKVGLLIGLLFLSGGMFYFFASGFSSPGGSLTGQGTTSMTTSPSVTSSTPSATTSTSTTSVSTSTSTSPTTSTTTQTTGSPSTTATQSVSMSAPSCPSRVTASSTFTCTITVYDQGTTTYSSSTIVSSGDFSKFTFVSCTESINGGPATQVSTSSNTIATGNLAPGTTVLTLTVEAPSQSGQYSNSVLTLNAPGFAQPISVVFAMQVTA